MPPIASGAFLFVEPLLLKFHFVPDAFFRIKQYFNIVQRVFLYNIIKPVNIIRPFRLIGEDYLCIFVIVGINLYILYLFFKGETKV